MAKEIKFNVKLTVDGKEQLGVATADVKKLRQSLDEAKSSTQQFRDKLLTVNQAVTALQNASSAMGNLRDTLSGLTASYNAVQQSNTLLTTVMRQRINATDEDIKKVKEVISTQTKLGVISGTVQRMGAQQIATFLKEKGTLETLIPAMNDLVAQQKGIGATGEDARGVANLMGKAMMGQTSALRRVGITFTDAQEQVMKFGNEQQRAAMLANIITDNVGHMNSALANTSAGKLKQIEMGFGSIKVKMGEMASNLMPFVSFSAMALTTATSVITLGKSMSGVILVVKSLNIQTKLWTVLTATARASVVGLTAVLNIAKAAFTGATIGATTLKIAIKSLLISTGVGIAVWALAEAVTYFMSSSDKAAESTRELTQAEEDAKAAREAESKQRAEIVSAIDINIAKLKNFKGSKEEEKKLVGEMNTTYGEAMGYYSTVAQWYTALTGNSKAYCDQMINEARIRDLANKAAELQQKKRDITTDENGKTRYYSAENKIQRVATGQVDAGDGKIIAQYKDVEVKGSSDLAQATKAYKKLDAEERAIRKEMDALVKRNANTTYQQFEGYQATAPTTATASTTPPTTTSNTTETPKTIVEKLNAQLSEAKKELENAVTIEAKVTADTKIKDIQAQIDEATKGKVTIGAETDSSYILQGSTADKRQSYSNAQNRINSLKSDYEIGIIGKDEAEKDIADINKQLTELGLKPVEVSFDVEKDALQEQLSEAQKEFKNAVTVDAKVDASVKIAGIQAKINESTNGKLTIKAAVEPSYIVEGSLEDKRQSYSNAQNRANQIQSDYEIGLIGKDEALREIDEINEEISKLGGNLKPMKLEVETKGFDSAMSSIKDGWGSIQGIGSGIEGITEALEGDGNAWEKVSSMLNGFISIAQGIQGIAKLFNTLTGATTAHAAAAGVDAAATTADTEASTANTTAKSGEAVATATASGAKLPFPANIAAIAAGVAAVVAALAMVSGFATGGVIGGTSTSGDKKFARVNSGEMILNKSQQARLFGLIEGRYQAPVFTDRSPQPVAMQNMSSGLESAGTQVNINMNANARRLLDITYNAKRVARKSGRNYNV